MPIAYGCELADLILTKKSSCLRCPFPDCILPDNEVPTFKETIFKQTAANVFNYIPAVIMSKLLSVDMRTIKRYRRDK